MSHTLSNDVFQNVSSYSPLSWLIFWYVISSFLVSSVRWQFAQPALHSSVLKFETIQSAMMSIWSSNMSPIMQNEWMILLISTTRVRSYSFTDLCFTFDVVGPPTHQNRHFWIICRSFSILGFNRCDFTRSHHCKFVSGFGHHQSFWSNFCNFKHSDGGTIFIQPSFDLTATLMIFYVTFSARFILAIVSVLTSSLAVCSKSSFSVTGNFCRLSFLHLTALSKFVKLSSYLDTKLVSLVMAESMDLSE